MKHTVHRLFYIWDFDKEEKWLNEMAARGLTLSAVGLGYYVFEESAPAEYTVRLEMLPHRPSHPESQQYIRFLEDTGAEHVASLKTWVYFRKKKTLGEFDLFSDNASRLRHLKRMLVIFPALFLMLCSAGAVNISAFLMHHNAVNLVCTILILAMLCWIGWGFVCLRKKKHKLEKESRLFE